MYLWIDTKNRKECISDYYIKCIFCHSRYECKNFDCENYEKYAKGQHIFHAGELGSALIGIIPLDIKELKGQIRDSCISYLNKKNCNRISEYDWIRSFTSIKDSLGKFYDIFCILSPMRGFYWRFVHKEKYTTATVSNKKGMLSYEIKERFMVFQCILEYINSCLRDTSFYDSKKYEFADRYYFVIDRGDRLKELEQDSIDLKYNIPFGKSICDFSSPSKFIKDLNEKFKTEKNDVQNEGFELYDKVYIVEDMTDFARVELFEILKSGYNFKKCDNCGVVFIPYNRSNTIYCDRPSPQDTSKSCKEYGARQTYQKNLSDNEAMRLYRNIYMAKQMRQKRNPDIEAYKINFEEYKTESKHWKSDVKKGLRTEVEFLNWLKAAKRKEFD